MAGPGTSPPLRYIPLGKEQRPPSALPPAWQNARRVYGYLVKRGIAPRVIESFLRAGLLYEDSLHHNCVFVGRDKDGKAVFAAKRGTYDRPGEKGFKGDVAGSDKTVAFSLPCDLAADWVAVFEAPIDLMSFCTPHRGVACNAVALCGLSEGALDTYLRNHPHIRQIFLCLDADEPGQQAAEVLRQKYEKAGYQVSIRTPERGKD